MNYQPVIAGNQSNPSAGVQEQFDAEKAGEDSPSNAAASPTHGKSSYDVGAEADFNNLETSITIYVDDIIFGSTNKDLCKAFKKLKKDKFQMSSMGELTFFLDGKSASIPIDTKKPLLKDPNGKFDGKADEGLLVGYSNTDDATNFKVKEPEFEVKEPESTVHVSPSSSAKSKKHDDKTKREAKGKSHVELSTGFRNLSKEFEDFFDNNLNEVNAASTLVPAVGQSSTNSTNTFSAAGPSNTDVSPTLGKSSYVDPSQYLDDLNIPALEDITYSDNEEDVGVKADFSNLETNITISPIPTTRVHKDHHVTQINGDLSLAPQTRSMTRMVKEQGGLTQINNDDFHTCKFACFLSQEEPKRMDVKSAFLYGTIKEEVYVCQPPGFEDPDYPDKVYKVVEAIYGLHQAPRAWYETLANYLLENNLCKAFEKLMKDKFQMSSMGELTFFLGLQVKQKQDEIFISQDKYVAEILRKFGLTDRKSASTPIDTEKPLLKDPGGEDVDVHTYRYLKGKPHLGLWYPKDSPFNLVAYSDSDYASASLDRKSPTGSCQFLGCRLISWQCKKQTVVATSSTEAEYVAVATLHLDDAASIDYFPNKEIFAELARMGLVRNVHSSSKFYMYPRFLQLMISAQVGDLSSHTTKYTSPALTQKVFSNIRKIGKGFSRVDTPLFEGMFVPQQAADDVADDVVTKDDAEPTPPSPTPTTPPPPQELPSTSQKVKALEQDKIAQALGFTKLKQRVRRLKKKNKLKVSRGIIDEIDAYEDVILEEVDVEKDVKVAKKDDDVIKQVKRKEKEDNAVLRYQALKRKPQTEAQARKNMMVYLKNMARFKLDFFKCMSYDDIRPIFKKDFNYVVGLLEKSKKELEEEASRALKRKSESSEQKAFKKQKLDEEVEEMKKHLQIVRDDKDDVYTKATPLALKVPVVDYQIHTKNNKPYYKVIRADGTHQLFLSFLSLLRNFNREDLEMLWQIVQERFASSNLKNFSDNFLLITLKAMFEKPNVEDHIWKNQRGIHGLAKMLNNVRLEVEEESEVSLELLRFMRRQYFGVDAVEDFKEFTLRDYYCWLKTYNCWYKLKMLDNAADSRLRLLEESVVADDKMKK
nr:hypothetical protein [Tanacetum cinerariifolium]